MIRIAVRDGRSRRVNNTHSHPFAEQAGGISGDAGCFAAAADRFVAEQQPSYDHSEAVVRGDRRHIQAAVRCLSRSEKSVSKRQQPLYQVARGTLTDANFAITVYIPLVPKGEHYKYMYIIRDNMVKR